MSFFDFSREHTDMWDKIWDYGRVGLKKEEDNLEFVTNDAVNADLTE